ncbi:MAG: pyridoxal phosphate-dependent aminotransferase [Candidatus Krumholzibacteriia bacterium]
MTISLIARGLRESATLKMNERVSIMRAKGDPVIHLGGGEPKSLPPLDALTAAAAMLSSGEVRYTPAYGTPEMKAAIIRATADQYGFRPTPAMVMASGGAKQAIMCALQAVLDPQDEVVFPAPYWVSYPEMVKMCGAVPVPALPMDGGYVPTIEDITQRLSSATKAIMINSPNNPSGAIYPESFIRDVVALCEREGYYLIMDDIYTRLVFGGRRVTNPIACAADFGSEDCRLIVINGVSKVYAMTGFRIGWAVANPRLIEVMSIIQSHQTSGPSALLQKAAVAAINGTQNCVENLVMTLENNAKVMLQRLQAFDGVRVCPPDGTFYCFADFSAYDKDSRRLAEFLLDKVMVCTVPGVEFGMEGHLRLSTCGSSKDIIQGIERIKWALDPNSPNELIIGQRKRVRDWL